MARAHFHWYFKCNVVVETSGAEMRFPRCLIHETSREYFVSTRHVLNTKNNLDYAEDFPKIEREPV
jgi:hypothetical protein